MARRRKGDRVDDEILYDPSEEIDFEEGLPSTTSARRHVSSDENKSVCKYSSEIDFEEGLPSYQCKVEIKKAAVENIPTVEVGKVPVKIHPVVEKKTSEIEKKIIRRFEGGKILYCVESEESGRSFGCYQTEEQAIVRLQQIEGFVKQSPQDDALDSMLLTDIKKESDFPYVLTWEAVRKKYLPEDCRSGLVKSLESDVPPRFRYWKCKNYEDRLAVREALVEEGIFTKDTVQKVNGVLRRAIVETVEKLYLPPVYDDGVEVEVPQFVKPIVKFSDLLKSRNEKEIVLFDEKIVNVVGLETILEKAKSLDSGYVICVENADSNKRILQGPIYKLKSTDDFLFVTDCDVVCERLVECVRFERPDELVKYALSSDREIRIIKSEEERTVYGIVLEPDEIDSQNDTISEDEIRQACYKFMENYGHLGRQHKEIVTGDLVLLENFIAPVDFEIEGQKVKKGTWLLKERVVSDKLWESVKKGEYTGFSIGGSGVRTPVK